MGSDALHKGLLIGIEQLPLLVEIVRYRYDILANALGGFADVGLGNGDRAIDHRAGAVGEPSIKPPAQGNGRKKSDDDGGKRGNKAEQADQPDVETGARDAVTAGLHELPYLPTDHARHQGDKHEVGRHQAGDELSVGFDRREARENEIGRQAANNRQNDDRNASYGGKRMLARNGERWRLMVRTCQGCSIRNRHYH